MGERRRPSRRGVGGGTDHLAAAAHLPTEEPLAILNFQSPPGDEI